ncbi:chymotrypsin-2-like [Chironomus tepperi]|uniref:chymotrypsin-2-like n=1 Tax=Chironomus tepperi TaxID=113505 RepID=UPI00391F61BD
MLVKILSLILVVTAVNGVAINPFIIGGTPAQLGQVPFQASLRAWGTDFHFAGGAIISNRWVLTVAHKVTGRAENSINIIFGAVLITASGTSRRSDRIFTHPDFSFETMANDIACVRTGTSIPFGQTIQPIFMLGSIITDVGLTAQVSGFGATDPNKGENADNLMVLTVQTTSNDICRHAHGASRITDGHICTVGFQPNTGFCTTDVGSPLIHNANLIGIASWHPLPCGLDGYPDVYSRISTYRSWIADITGV